jgi:hypothetical protein
MSNFVDFTFKVTCRVGDREQTFQRSCRSDKFELTSLLSMGVRFIVELADEINKWFLDTIHESHEKQ